MTTLGNLIDEQNIVIDIDDGDYITHLMVVGRVLREDGESDIILGMPENTDAVTAGAMLRYGMLRIDRMVLGDE